MKSIGFQSPELLVLPLLFVLVSLAVLVRRDGYSRKVLTVHLLVLALLGVALSFPYLVQEVEAEDDRPLVVLEDVSPSSQLIEKPGLEFDDIGVERREINAGNSSSLENSMVRHLEPGKEYLVVSDMQTDSTERIVDKYSEANSSINFLEAGMESEASVNIKGPDSTVAGAENRFVVEVQSSGEGEIPVPEVSIDGSPVSLEEEDREGVWSFSHEFSEERQYRIKARIEDGKVYSRNDEFFKIVDVRKRPKILTVGVKGDLEEDLGEFYDITNKDSIPSDLEDYLAVILKKEVGVDEELREFAVEGNGIIQTGSLEGDIDPIYPVRSGDSVEGEEGAQIVFAIDSSVAGEDCPKTVCLGNSSITGETTNQALAVAYSLIDSLPFNNRVGAVAYRQEAYTLSKPEMLASNRNSLLSTLERIRPEGTGLHYKGLRGAHRLLDTEEENEGNIIMITDGYVNPANSLFRTDEAKRLSSSIDAQVITVGVGENPNRDFLEKVAENGGGFYLEASESEKLEFRFDAGGAADETVPLVSVNPSHYITEDIEIDASATAFDGVSPRRGADQLVTGTNGNTYLTTWNYGLGRVATFSAGSSDLSNIMTVEPDLVSRTVAWAVGDPDREEEEFFNVESGRLGEPVEARSSEPVEGFRRVSGGEYAKEIEPESTGIHEVADHYYAYNYEEEIQDIGYSDKMYEVAAETGGEIYSTENIDQLKEEISSSPNTKMVEQRMNLAPFLIAVALIILLVEIGYRKRLGRK